MTNDIRTTTPFPPKWVIYAAFGLFAAVVVLAGFFGYGLVQSEHDIAVVSQERHQTIQQLSKNNDALRTQVEKLGQKPVAPPAAEVIAAAGENGKNGLNGTNGESGRGVVSFTCESDGTWLILYSDATTASVNGPCIGQTGATGAAGADSTIAGPAGSNGADGAAGQPPVSWTFPFTDELGQTTTYTCNRADPFDPAAPTYTCTPN